MDVAAGSVCVELRGWRGVCVQSEACSLKREGSALFLFTPQWLSALITFDKRGLLNPNYPELCLSWSPSPFLPSAWRIRSFQSSSSEINWLRLRVFLSSPDIFWESKVIISPGEDVGGSSETVVHQASALSCGCRRNDTDQSSSTGLESRTRRLPRHGSTRPVMFAKRQIMLDVPSRFETSAPSSGNCETSVKNVNESRMLRIS